MSKTNPTNSRAKRQTPDAILEQAPPRDFEAESALLGSILVSPSLMPAMATRLSEDDFYEVRHRAVWRAMQRLHAKRITIDITLLVGELRDAGDYGTHHDQASAALLCRFYRLYPSATLAPYYAARLKEMSRRRHALERGHRLIAAANRVDVQPRPSATAQRRSRRLA